MNGGQLKLEILKRINPDMKAGVRVSPITLRANFSDEELTGVDYEMALQSLMETRMINVIEHTALPNGRFEPNLIELSANGMLLIRK